MGMIDLIVFSIVLVSGLFAFYRGLVRELLGLIAWILAAFGAFYGLILVRPLFRKMITNPTVADIVAAVVIALIILVICTIINAKINEKLRKSVLSGLDRILGFVFGILRGALLIVFIYFFIAFALPAQTIEKYSNKNWSVSYLSKTIPWLEKLLPDSLVKGLRDMQKEEPENLEKPEEKASIKSKPNKVDEKEPVPYNNQDLESMDTLLKAIE